METKERKNFQQLADFTDDLIEELKTANFNAKKIKEQVNAVGKITNLYKLKLEYNLNRHKLETIQFFEDKPL